MANPKNNTDLSSKVKLHDLESIMKAAETESSLLEDPLPESGSNIEHLTSPQEIPSIHNPNDVKEALKNTNISAMLNQMAANPEEVNKMMEESMSRMTPEMMEQARKLAMGGQGDQIMKEMKKRGLDPRVLKAQMREQQKALRGLENKNIADTKQVVLITTSRQVKTRKLPNDNYLPNIKTILKCNDPVELSCSRLAQGPLSGKTIKVWYNPEHTGKNRRATKIVGFPIGGEIIVIVEEDNLTETNFLAAEKTLE